MRRRIDFSSRDGPTPAVLAKSPRFMGAHPLAAAHADPAREGELGFARCLGMRLLGDVVIPTLVDVQALVR